MAAEPSPVELLKIEYDRLKVEQAQRIGFRDNMLFVHLAAVGGVASWVFTNLDKPHGRDALFIIPWVCLVLGWTYLVNDHAVSRIGKYLRHILEKRATQCSPAGAVEYTEDDNVRHTISDVFGWEPFHRLDKRRYWRKRSQFIVDALTFIAPGALALIGFAVHNGFDLPWHYWTAIAVEALCLLWLLWQVFVYADFGWGEEAKAPAA